MFGSIPLRDRCFFCGLENFTHVFTPKKTHKSMCLIVRSKLNLNLVLSKFSTTHEWWLSQVSRLFLLACPLFPWDIFLAAGLRRGEKIQQEFGPLKPIFLHARLFCTQQQILSLRIKAVWVEVTLETGGVSLTGFTFNHILLLPQ